MCAVCWWEASQIWAALLPQSDYQVRPKGIRSLPVSSRIYVRVPYEESSPIFFSLWGVSQARANISVPKKGKYKKPRSRPGTPLGNGFWQASIARRPESDPLGSVLQDRTGHPGVANEDSPMDPPM